MQYLKIRNMTSILNNNKFLHAIAGAVLLLFFLTPFLAFAQSSLTLSVTPTLFEMSANPGQIWESSVKVVNNNAFDITVFPSVVNFRPQGETGQGQLLPVLEASTEGTTLAEWIELSSDPITIPKEQSKTIPFTVMVPEDASPGGHFAAILVSTNPPENENLAVKTAQVVTSLFFVRVSGDVIEKGDIRSFSATQRFVQKPEATFALRFENKGNVHLQPQGDITILNMWGKERGKIPINYRTHFGNVLPGSIRKFDFSWSGEQSISDIGRYKAVVSLAYGIDQKQFSTRSTYFWVIPVKSLLITLGSFLVLVFGVLWGVKLYVRRMLSLAGVPTGGFHAEVEERHSHEHEPTEGDITITSYRSIAAPVHLGLKDLRARFANREGIIGKIRALLGFVSAYRLFFAGVTIFVIAVVALVLYISDVTNDKKSYDITIDNPDAEVSMTSEEILYTDIATENGLPELGVSGQAYEIGLANTSGVAGTAAETAAMLAEKGYTVAKITTEKSRIDKRTVIVADPSLQQEALALSKLMKGVPLSTRPASSTMELPNITIFVGQDRIAE